MSEAKVTAHFLPKHQRGGPMGLGDPDDRSLRNVEKNVLIPKLMKEEAIKLCSEEVAAFTDCGKKHGLKITFNCREENKAMQTCYAKYFNDEKFPDEMKKKYLEERSEYRRTGVPQRKYDRR